MAPRYSYYVVWVYDICVCLHPQKKALSYTCMLTHTHTHTLRYINTSTLWRSSLRGQSHYSLFCNETCPSLSSAGSIWPARATINRPLWLPSPLQFPLITLSRLQLKHTVKPRLYIQIYYQTQWVVNFPLLRMCPNINTEWEKGGKL